MSATTKNKPFILILSGPSGSGKSTLAKALISSTANTIESVSHTTRQPRPGEHDGKDYYFVSKDFFVNLLEQKKMLEYAEVYDNHYGTSAETIEKAVSNGTNIILDVDWQGARRIKERFPEAISLFLMPPSESAVLERLTTRSQDSEEVIKQRMSIYAEQISHKNEFDHVLINDNFDTCHQKLLKILSSHKL